jgi:HAD superfamily hydrolase (TIGR01509 family)
LHEHAKGEALRRAGIEVAPERFAAFTGRTDRAMIFELAAEQGRSISESDAILSAKREIFEELEHGLLPIDGALAFVRGGLESSSLALATSATPRHRAASLERLGITSLFEVTVDSAQVTEPKPSPEVFQKAVAELRLSPQDCWVIEDSVSGILAAKAAGCFAVGLTTSFPESALREAGADLVVATFEELRCAVEAA